MEHQLKARIQILEANDTEFSRLESGPRLWQSRVRETLFGDIDGTGTISHLLLRELKGYSYFTGFEEIKCNIRKFSGGFIMRETGIFGKNVLAADCLIIEGSGFGDLSTIAGAGRIEMDKEGPYIQITCSCQSFDD